jgi:hypothetical protein
MLLYKWWFENQLAMDPRLQSFTLSPESARIEGMPLAGVEEILDRPTVRPQIEAVKRRLGERGGDGERTEERKRELEGAVSGIVEDLRTLETLTVKGMTGTERLGGLLSSGRDAGGCLRALDAIDRRILELASRDIAGFLVQSTIRKISGSGERKLSEAEILARSGEMYRGMHESAVFQRELLERALRLFR